VPGDVGGGRGGGEGRGRGGEGTTKAALKFLPPFAEVGFVPYTNMTENRDAYYANFRFFSEVLLADMVPRDIETGTLYYHNSKVGDL
jgi:hypothetical protein